MTLVVTHTQGYLGCFTQEPDGSMRQRALIDTGSEPQTPQQLAELGTILADQWGWVLNGHSLKSKSPPRALPTQKKPDPVKALKEAERQKKKHSGYKHRKYPPVDQREAMILECLSHHPGSTIREVLEHLKQPTDNAATGNWNHTFTALRTSQKVTRVGTGHSDSPYRYSVAG